MEGHDKTYQRRTSQLFDQLEPGSPTSSSSPALSDGSSSSESHSTVLTPTNSDDGHSAALREESKEKEVLAPALPPLRPEAWGQGSERPFRHLGLDTRLSEKIISRDSEHSNEEEASAEDRLDFGLSSEVSKSDKIKGKLTTFLGRITNNDSKILEGQVRSNGAHLALRSDERSPID